MCYDCFSLKVDETIKKIVLKDGTIEYRNSKGDIHNINDEPAVIYVDGTKMWCKNGMLHRDNDPAIEECGGAQFWYKNGLLHRDGDLPAAIYADGSKTWYKNGVWEDKV